MTDAEFETLQRYIDEEHEKWMDDFIERRLPFITSIVLSVAVLAAYLAFS